MKIHWKKESLNYMQTELNDSNIKYNDHWRFFERIGEFLTSVTPRNKELYRNPVEDLLEDLYDMFNQHCQIEYKEHLGKYYIKYDHMCLSSNEDAQYTLIKYGRIKESECVRK